MTSIYVTHPRYVEHNLPGHPEHAGRIKAVWETLAEAKLTERLQQVEAEPIDPKWILNVHSERYLATLQSLEKQEQVYGFDSDTYALPVTYQIARLAAGGVIQAVEAVLRGDADNGLAVIRPPGHHALAGRGMGFCILGNIAIAARYAQKKHTLKRVMILDYDVHHGNGTEAMFYDDDSVLYISTHQYPFYPGTGALQDIGSGKGRGYTLNVPLSAGHGDANYARIFEQVIWPVARRFQPELILVSAGFDAHFSDPLAMMSLSLPGYAHLDRELMAMADALCDGKIVFVMEGGYDLQALGHGMRNVAHALLGEDDISDPFGKRTQSEPDIGPLIDRLCAVHGL